MICSYCSTPNSDANRFCGECGQPLVRQHVTVPESADIRYPDARFEYQPHQTTISGPSFLGLTTDDDNEPSGYLLEDEPPHRSHAGWYIFSFVAIVVLSVIGWVEWQAIKTGKVPIPALQAAVSRLDQQAPGNPAPPSPTNPAASPNGNTSTGSTDTKPQSDDNNQATPNTASGSVADGHNGDAASTDTTTAASSASDATSDEQATRDAQARITKEADQRKADEAATSDDDSDQTPSTASSKTALKSKPASVPKPPDPRQDRMLLSGEKYLYGRGVPQDCNQALIYLKAAAERENGPAMSHLGAMYASGHCVTANRVVAYRWFSRASEVDHNEWISRNLNMLWRDMTPQERASVSR